MDQTMGRGSFPGTKIGRRFGLSRQAVCSCYLGTRLLLNPRLAEFPGGAFRDVPLSFRLVRDQVFWNTRCNQPRRWGKTISS